MKQNYTQIPEHIYARCIFMLLLFNQYISNKKKKKIVFRYISTDLFCQ